MSKKTLTAKITKTAITTVVDAITPPIISLAEPLVKQLVQELVDYFISRVNQPDYTLPPVALVGIGHCGTNICEELSSLIATAIGDPTQVERQWASMLFNRVVKKVREKFTGERDPIFQVTPLVFLADFDKNLIEKMSERRTQYPLLLPVNLSWLIGNGTGNNPAKGQYIARIALEKEISTVNEATLREKVSGHDTTSWNRARAFLLDGIGNRNLSNTTTCFTVFSTGGGSGSGMTLELAAAQRILMCNPPSAENSVLRHFEPPAMIGIAVLPGIQQNRPPNNSFDAQHFNSGRLIARYLASCGRGQKTDRITRAPFDAVLLFSNEHLLSESGGLKEAGQAANRYVSKQIFNLIYSQSLVEDFAETKHLATSVDQIRFDATDIKNSISGMCTIAYSEAEPGDLVIQNLFRKALSPISSESNSEIHGISVLPQKRTDYISPAETDLDSFISGIAELEVFQKCQCIVGILSAPELGLVRANQIEQLRANMGRLSRSRIRRWALVTGLHQTKYTLTLIMSDTGFLNAEPLRELYYYCMQAFKKDDVSPEDFDKNFWSYLRGRSQDRRSAEAVIRDQESIGSILAGVDSVASTGQLKEEMERRSEEVLARKIDFNSVLLNKVHIMRAADYCRDVVGYHPPSPPPERL